MKKLFIVCLILSSSFLHAQDKALKFSASPSLAIPTGLWAALEGIGGSGEVNVAYPLTDNVNLTGSVGFGFFSGKTIDFGIASTKTNSSTFIPVIAGLDYKLNQIHFGIGLGYVNYTTGTSFGGFTFRPHAGFEITDKIQLNVNYTSTSTDFVNINYVGISPVFKF
jgi:hypothetical protein